MLITQDYLEELREKCGATHCATIRVEDIVLDAGLRSNCEMNYCGEYGRTWVCPPHCGSIEDCIENVRAYDGAVVIQYVGTLEDSYDFEGMQEAANIFNDVFLKAVRAVKEHVCQGGTEKPQELLCLGAGGCHRCGTCALATEEPCRFPEEAFASLESHGIFVSDLAGKAGLNYINGQNTVTYFGAIFFNDNELLSQED